MSLNNTLVRKVIDLNSLEPKNDGNFPDEVFIGDNSVVSDEGEIQVYFRNLVPKLKEHIKQARVVFGCVAWLTNYEILDSLAEKYVSIVVQKEDFLRPDIGSKSSWKKDLRGKYNKLSSGPLDRWYFPNTIRSLSVCSNWDMQPVRCMGNHNRDKAPAFPRMHNKFLVFSNIVEGEVSPYAVWTGSFNLTLNASNSLENALYITNPKIVNAYAKEFEQIFSLSEPLDWESDWCEPEFRIGT